MQFLQFSLFMHPDQAQNTSSGIQGQEATAVAVIYVTAPNTAVSLLKVTTFKDIPIVPCLNCPHYSGKISPVLATIYVADPRD